MTYFNLTELQEAATEKSGWSVSTELNPPSSVSKYNRCVTPTDVVAVDANYETDIVDGNWDYRLDSLTDGKNLFDGVTTLESFNVNLPNLTNGYRMFSGCKLKTFKGSLPNLTNGYQMFENCRLDAQSVANILKDINDVSQIPNGESYTADVYKTIDIDGYAAGWEAYNNFHHNVAINAGKSSWAELKSEVEAKGWTLRVTCSSDRYYGQ